MKYTNEILKLANQIYHMFYTSSHDNGSKNRILYFILTNHVKDGICQKDIQDNLNIRAATVSVLLGKLEKQGLILRETESNDGRKKKIYPTNSAIQKKDNIHQELVSMEDKLIAGISENELHVFKNVMEKMLKNIS